jgi:hypothetical protein
MGQNLDSKRESPGLEPGLSSTISIIRNGDSFYATCKLLILIRLVDYGA